MSLSYCEENIYKAAEALLCSSHVKSIFVVVISNELRKIPLFKQRLRPDGPVVWDYHVILIYSDNEEKKSYEVLDYDSELSVTEPLSQPETRTVRLVEFSEYASQTFRPELRLNPDYRRYYKCIDAEIFIKNFSSDRSHMLVKGSTTEHSSPVPPWPTIQKAEMNNLDMFIDMSSADPYGVVLDEPAFLTRFGVHHDPSRGQ